MRANYWFNIPHQEQSETLHSTGSIGSAHAILCYKIPLWKYIKSQEPEKNISMKTRSACIIDVNVSILIITEPSSHICLFECVVHWSDRVMI